jgi:hypothetical protein
MAMTALQSFVSTGADLGCSIGQWIPSRSIVPVEYGYVGVLLGLVG